MGDDVRRRLQACSPEAVDADVAALGARLGRHPLVLLLLRAVHAAMRGQLRVHPTQQAAVDEQSKGKQKEQRQGQGGRPAVGTGAAAGAAQVPEAKASSSDSGSSDDEGDRGAAVPPQAHAGGRQPGEAAPAAAGDAGAAVPKKAAKRAGTLEGERAVKQLLHRNQQCSGIMFLLRAQRFTATDIPNSCPWLSRRLGPGAKVFPTRPT